MSTSASSTDIVNFLQFFTEVNELLRHDISGDLFNSFVLLSRPDAYATDLQRSHAWSTLEHAGIFDIIARIRLHTVKDIQSRVTSLFSTLEQQVFPYNTIGLISSIQPSTGIENGFVRLPSSVLAME